MQLIREQMPSDISTVEQAIVWLFLLLDEQARGMTIKEDAGIIPTPVSQVQIVTVADNTTRIISRVSIELQEDWAVNRSVKLWRRVKEVVTTSIPSHFTTN